MTTKLICIACEKEEAGEKSRYCLDCEFSRFLAELEQPVLRTDGLWSFEPVPDEPKHPDYVYRVLGWLLVISVTVFAWVAVWEFR